MATTLDQKLLDSCSHIKLKNNLKIDNRFATIKRTIITRITTDLENYMNYKFCVETVLLACNLVENLVLPTDNIDKQALVCEVFVEVFSMTETEIATLKNTINFLSNHGRIKSFSRWFFLVMRIFKFCSGK